MGRFHWIIRRDLDDEEWDIYLRYWWVPRLKAGIAGFWAGVVVVLLIEWLRSR